MTTNSTKPAMTKSEIPTSRVIAAKLAARGRDCLLTAEEFALDDAPRAIVSELARAALNLLRRAEEVCPGYRSGTGDHADDVERALRLV